MQRRDSACGADPGIHELGPPPPAVLRHSDVVQQARQLVEQWVLQEGCTQVILSMLSVNLGDALITYVSLQGPGEQATNSQHYLLAHGSVANGTGGSVIAALHNQLLSHCRMSSQANGRCAAAADFQVHAKDIIVQPAQCTPVAAHFPAAGWAPCAAP